MAQTIRLKIVFYVFAGLYSSLLLSADEPELPNVLWLTTEDVGPELNCYGDSTARTPNLDALAARGMVYDVAWSNYPGLRTSTNHPYYWNVWRRVWGAGNMRSLVPLPNGFKLFPQYLREAGYYCTNNSKEDYNVIKQGQVWDESSRKAHYKNRAKDQPFFAVFNFTGTHESRIRKRPHQAVIAPANVRLRTYWPDLPEVRQDWAQYYDNLQSMDVWIGKKLRELEHSGLVDETVVFFFGDHGSGMPRHKRYAGDSGQRVPLIIHVPDKFKHLAPHDYRSGGRSRRLTGFIDLAPTMLSIADVEPPNHMIGAAIMGKKTGLPEYLFGYRDRMDERPDISRSVRDHRFIYIRNYMPFLPAGQFIHYQQQTPTTALWRRKFLNQQLNNIQSQFWRPHPAEELYDLQSDPEETLNLAGNPQYLNHLQRFRRVHQMHVLNSGDLGFIHEGDLFEWTRENGSPTRILNTTEYQVDRVFDFARQATSPDCGVDVLLTGLKSDDQNIRYWAAIGLRSISADLEDKHFRLLAERLTDQSPAVAIVAADTMATSGSKEFTQKALSVLIHFANYENSNAYYALHALNAIDRLDEGAKPLMRAIKELPVDDGLKRGGGYLKRLVQDIMSSK